MDVVVPQALCQRGGKPGATFARPTTAPVVCHREMAPVLRSNKAVDVHSLLGERWNNGADWLHYVR